MYVGVDSIQVYFMVTMYSMTIPSHFLLFNIAITRTNAGKLMPNAVCTQYDLRVKDIANYEQKIPKSQVTKAIIMNHSLKFELLNFCIDHLYIPSKCYSPSCV